LWHILEGAKGTLGRSLPVGYRGKAPVGWWGLVNDSSNPTFGCYGITKLVEQ